MKKGITLISLVITIIVILILAGVGISGSLALIEEAKYAAFINEMKQADEAVYLVIMEGQLEQKTTEEILADIGERIPEEVLKKISNNLKLEILYARAGFPEDELPISEDYSEELANFSSEENLNSLFLVNVSVAGKEKAYIYDEQSASVYKVEPTIIWGVEMHGFDYGNLLVSRPGLLEKAQNKEENTTEIGQKVELKEGWGTQTVEYIKTSDGTVVKDVDLVATVYAVSVGEGETVPVPKDFYYVGGNLSTGVIISDNSDDRYGYNPETQEENDTELDKTTYEYTTKLKGNQFVWIPCTEDEYAKRSWGANYQSANWEDTTEAGEIQQIQKYGGFYVARYEAGLATTIKEFTETQGFISTIYNEDGIPQSRAEQIPWMYINWTQAKKNAQSMYNNEYVSSGLITGTQWDVMLNKIVEKTELDESKIINSYEWGNYADTQIDYTGRVARATGQSNSWSMEPFGEKTTGETASAADFLTTGASSVTEKYHIYDVAGNLWEWTEENSNYTTTGQYRVFRGGSACNSSVQYSACYRFGQYDVSAASFDIGFRVVLYIK